MHCKKKWELTDWSARAPCVPKHSLVISWLNAGRICTMWAAECCFSSFSHGVHVSCFLFGRGINFNVWHVDWRRLVIPEDILLPLAQKDGVPLILPTKLWLTWLRKQPSTSITPEMWAVIQRSGTSVMPTHSTVIHYLLTERHTHRFDELFFVFLIARRSAWSYGTSTAHPEHLRAA